MKTFRIYPSSVNGRYIEEAVETLHNGGIVVYPTDSLYALGCDALNNRAIERICQVKGIDTRRNNLSIVCESISQASEYARIDNIAFRLLKAYMPGPLTMILPAATTLPKVFKNRHTVGIRIPDNPIAHALAEALGHPLLSTSAVDPEADGEYAANPELIGDRYSSVADIMINGGEGLTVPSTVVDLCDSANPVVLREGLGEFEV